MARRSFASSLMRICIIGGGLVGLAAALQLRRARPGDELVLLEKEPAFGRHQSTHNSGVLHAGLYYKPGSAKARLAVRGIRLMTEFCREHGVAHEVCGKLVVAVDGTELVRLRALLERGTQNGLQGLRWLERDEFRAIEPHAAGLAAVQVPDEGIVDYAAVVAAMAEENRRLGADLRTGARVLGLRRDGSWRIEATPGEFRADFVVNCGGLHCDRVAALAGEVRTTRIVPFRGEYYQLKAASAGLVRNLIYPVPDPTFPFLGVHFTRLIHGGIEAGPNAILATAREGYRKSDFNPVDLVDALAFGGLWRFVSRHRAMCWEEIVRAFSKRRFCASLQKLVPEVTESDLEPGGAGVRAQAMTPAGDLLQDFELVERPDALHVLNAPSPAATASLAIGEEIAARVIRQADARAA
jgi:L-2-hydroxyglutarate oxidase